MTKEESFNKYFKSCHDNIYSMILLRNDMVFYAKNSEKLFQPLAKKFKLIPRIQGMTFRLLVIHLYTILKDNESHSFYKLITKHIMAFGDGKESTEHKVLLTKLKKLQAEKMYEVIKNLRNKHYAHLDLDRETIDVTLSIEGLDNYIKKIEELFKDIYSLVKPGTTVSLIGLKTEVDMFTYKALERYISLDNLYLNAKIEHKNIIGLEEIGNIIRK
jgi:hypothetical protein